MNRGVNRNSPHFWIIFVRVNGSGWRAHAGASGDYVNIVAYRTKKEAASDLAFARLHYTQARLYKVRPESYIYGGHK